MDDTTFFKRLQVTIIVAVCLIVLVLFVQDQLRPQPGTSFYFLTRETLRDRIGTNRFFNISGPSELRLERIDDRSTNVYGWAITTNTDGLTTTQWFKLAITLNESARPVAKSLRISATDSFSTNASDSPRPSPK